MHPSYTGIFTILRQSLFPNEQDTATISPEADWDYIYQEMQNQAVSTLAYPWLKTHTLPDSELQQKWTTSCLQQQARWIQVMHAQTQLINLLEQHNIPCVIIKGAAAMMPYPHPPLRAVGDIDFLVKRTDYEKAATLLENNGYNIAYEKKATKHHYNYEKDGISFELHRRLETIKETDEYLLSLFENGIDNRLWHTVANIKFPTLPDDLNGLVLLLHINQHLREGIGLRQIIDWMMYLYKNYNLSDTLPLTKITGMEKLAITVTVMCQRYLGLPHKVEESDELPVDELMDYIISAGNMGNKAGLEGRISSFSTTITNPIQALSRLQKTGLSTWEAAKKHRILRPFAWIYRIGCVYNEMHHSSIPLAQFIKSHYTGIEQRELIHKLELETDRSIKNNL